MISTNAPNDDYLSLKIPKRLDQIMIHDLNCQREMERVKEPRYITYQGRALHLK